MPIEIGPIPADLICEQYHLEAADFAALAPNIRSLFRLAYAADVMHVQEVPNIGQPGNEDGSANTGPEVNRVLGICGFPDGGEPWCAAIGTGYLVDSGVPRSQLPVNAASVHGWLEWATENDLILTEPVRGCAGLLIFNATAGHFTTVTDVPGDGTILTLEGNSNTNGSAEGYEMVRHRRPISEIHAFVDLSKLTS